MWIVFYSREMGLSRGWQPGAKQFTDTACKSRPASRGRRAARGGGAGCCDAGICGSSAMRCRAEGWLVDAGPGTLASLHLASLRSALQRLTELRDRAGHAAGESSEAV